MLLKIANLIVNPNDFVHNDNFLWRYMDSSRSLENVFRPSLYMHTERNLFTPVQNHYHDTLLCEQ